ncbi:hypothetical protein BJX61DRAFT_530656 [Aspergillus egyptiacus]|nr:hypothetical protein BJX61DRAFT_530656 [Aspergillus egyptiacus]
MDTNVFRFLYNHIVLPPKQPGEREVNRGSLEKELLILVRDVMATFIKNRTSDAQKKWRTVVNMINTWVSIDGSGTLNEDILGRSIKELRTQGAIALHISAQNSGLIAYYDTDMDKIIIDAFEASALSAAVIEAQGSLIRCFPGQSVALPATIADDSLFCEYLAHNLCRLNMEVVREMCPKANASRDFIEEDRDTVHPGLVTEGLMVQLLAFGEHNAWKSFEKHVRDEVNYQDNRLPWRRSPVWFVLKVALQTVLQRTFPHCEGRTEYKNFMLYLAAELGLRALRQDVTDHSDILTFLRAKIARRIYKLESETFDFVSQRVGEVDKAMVKQLQFLHRQFQTPARKVTPQKISPVREKDLEASLGRCQDYLRRAMSSTSPKTSQANFNPREKQRLQFGAYGIPKLEDDQLSLFDFEAWVDTQLERCFANNMPSEDLCCALAELIQTYSNFAAKKYTGIPDAMSLMILVILKLWVSLDKLCIQACPLLQNFSPDLPESLLEPLLLPNQRQMQQAEEIEQYLRARQANSKFGSVFRNPGAGTFSARYFDISDQRKALRSRIRRGAKLEREKRRKLWEERTKEHQDLLSQASAIPHQSDVDEWGREIHLDSCLKCDLERKAADLSIEVHEWPLPEDDGLAKSFVFELACPRWFTKWRDTTWKIADDYCRTQDRVPSRPELILPQYRATRNFATFHGQRLTLASTTKSWVNTHYKSQKFPVNFDSIAVPNGLHLSLCDDERQVYVVARCKLPKPTVKHLCTFTVTSTLYADLQYAVESCGHGQNKVLADQRKRQSGMTLSELSAFGHLRCGQRLQWYNIAREVASPSIAMAEDAVHKLFCQTAWEVGSPSSETRLRQAHAFFEDNNSINRLLEMLEYRLECIKSNWTEKCTLHTLVVLGLRTLSLSSAVERAVLFLRSCRKLAMQWCTDLTTSLDAKVAEGDDTQAALLFRIGATCLLTYAVEDQHLPKLLSTQEDLSALARSSIFVFANTQQPYEVQSQDTRAMVIRTRRALQRAEQLVSCLIKADSSGLNNAIQQSPFSLGVTSTWTFYNGDSSRWAKNKTHSSLHGRQQELHYNILTGELLIDNEPPSRLPDKYTKHALFQRTFGMQTLSVIPSALGGSTFASSQRFGPYQVHFGFEDNELVVKAQEKQRVLRLIPHDCLDGDFPDCLVTNFAHWLEPDTGILEFRPLDCKWKTSERNWHLFYHKAHEQPSRTKHGERLLIDIRSEIFAQIAEVLQVLDAPKHILATVSPDGTVEAKLVRLHLTFAVNAEGTLECREHNAIVDPKQDIGCLYNLSNKLVLLGKSGQCRRRTVLIPYGTVKIAGASFHTEVSIELPDAPRIKYFHYLLDPDLGILTNTSGFLGTLYQAYLHAVTTSVLPDSATKRTGTEEALRILRQARMKSSFPLDSESTRLLEQIAALTPRRQYYPPILKSMQRVSWNRDLSEYAQHDDFRLVAQEIFDHAQQFGPFHKLRSDAPGPDRGDIGLLERARSRRVRFHRFGFGGAHLPPARPSEYKDARDRQDELSDRSRRVYNIAKLIQAWPDTLTSKADLFYAIQRWKHIDLQIRPPQQYPYSSLIQPLLVKEIWGSLYNQCRLSSRERDTYCLVSVFCMIAFGEPDIRMFLPLLAIAFSGSYPEIPSDLLEPGFDKGVVQGTDYGPNRKRLSKKEREKIYREQKKAYEMQKKMDIQAFEDSISRQWPCETLQRPANLKPWQVQGLTDCNQLVKRWYYNKMFFEFLRHVQDQLDAVRIDSLILPQPPAPPRRLLIAPRTTPWSPPSLHDLICASNAPFPMDTELERPRIESLVSASVDIHSSSDIHFLVYALRENATDLCKKYADDLDESLDALENMHTHGEPTEFPVGRDVLVKYYEQLSLRRDTLWSEIESALTTAANVWMDVGSAIFRPSVTVLSMVSFLAADKWNSIPAVWQHILVSFAKVISDLRQCERLLTHFDTGDVSMFFKEAETWGAVGWDASEVPDWLLLEIESNITIRMRQVEVAQKMMCPDSQQNSVLQLNMGEGKTTVITPMVALRLSDGHQLLRIIVIKPLLRQSVDLLSQRLGGLLNRPIYYIPFSRTTCVGEDTCQRQKGILIVLSEQLLSFRLVLDPKFQLIYTRGNQQNVDGDGDRWAVIQNVLAEVEKQAMVLRSEVESSLDIDQSGPRFPLLHFLTSDAPDKLLRRVIDAVNEGAVPGLPFNLWTPRIRERALMFIRDIYNLSEEEEVIRQEFHGSMILKKLLVLRGLFAHRILHFALAGKRWLVDYGVDSSRCLLAVPFRAKGVPSESSQFGHMDVALTLTCLSYYYGGLTEDQVKQCFSLVAKENDAGAEYQGWISRCQDRIPTSLHSFKGVNLEDVQTFKQVLYPHLQYQKGIIDFFLSRVVFPREAKEFPFKLSTSAWDIPSKPDQPLTTGFSGTNDNRYLLPISMPQRDLPDLLHTNAMVISQLLRDENKQCVLAEDEIGHQLSVMGLLELVSSQEPPIQVIIDVGAQILEATNQEVAEWWLSITPRNRAAAAIFHNENDEAMVLDREGYTERLLASSFRERMHLCIVFLDQCHSRGVDLRLPRNYRAAVTLGPRLTKDRLVQACHRMRELGNGQSVTFFVPPAVKHNISKADGHLTSYNVVQWALEQTCKYLERLQPLWAWQGLQHQRCMRASEALRSAPLADLLAGIQEPEAKTLLQLYAPWEPIPYSLERIEQLEWDPDVKSLLAAWRKSKTGATLLYEEHERQVSQETQKEPQVNHPPPVDPLKHTLHSDIRYFAKHGRLPDNDLKAIMPAFNCLSRTTASQFNIPAIGAPLYVTHDFHETIVQNAGTVDDEFLKPVYWVLSNVNNRVLMILSQYEANELLHIIKASDQTTLHLYAPRTAKDMRSFNKLDFLTIGKGRVLGFHEDLLLALEIFSGSLYFDTYADYERARHFFGLITEKTSNIGIPGDAITSEGFVKEEARNRAGWPVECPFLESPLPFLKTWYNIRTKGHGFSQSHMGSIIEGRPLREEHF